MAAGHFRWDNRSMMTSAAAASTNAGIVTSVASIFTAVILLITAILGLFQVRRLRKQGDNTNARLGVIHTLVNSTLTAEIEANLDASKRELATLDQLIAERRANGHEIAPETLAAKAACERKIGNLTQKMADRLRQAEVVLSQEGQLNPVT